MVLPIKMHLLNTKKAKFTVLLDIILYHVKPCATMVNHHYYFSCGNKKKDDGIGKAKANKERCKYRNVCKNLNIVERCASSLKYIRSYLGNARKQTDKALNMNVFITTRL